MTKGNIYIKKKEVKTSKYKYTKKIMNKKKSNKKKILSHLWTWKVWKCRVLVLVLMSPECRSWSVSCERSPDHMDASLKITETK